MNKKTNDVYKFLKLFRKEDETIIIGLKHENPKTKKILNTNGVIHVEMEMKKLNVSLNRWIGWYKKSKIYFGTYNKRGYGIFFIPNKGGTKNNEIIDIRSWFIDMDFAKIKEEFEEEDQAKKRKMELGKTGDFSSLEMETVHTKEDKLKYILRGLYTQEKISQFKNTFMDKHKKDLVNAVIVESYSGYHAYWIAENASIENFKKIQRALIRKFNSDPQIIKEAGLIRLPGFDHRKYDDSFELNVIQWSNKRFTEEELINSLELGPVQQEKGFVKEEIQEPVSYSSELTRSVTVIRKKQKSDLIFKSILPFEKMENLTFNESLERVLKEPLSTFIESPDMHEGDVCCPFHDDKNPSATIFIADNGEMLFYCHSCTIGTRNVIGLYMAHTGKGWRKSVEDLSKIIGIKVVETEFEREQFQKYRDNRHYLEQDLETLVQNTSHFIGRYGRKLYLRYFNDKAETNVLKEQFQYKNHNVFFISYRAIAKEMGNKNMQSVQNSVVLLNTLGFLERVPEECIPGELKQRAEKERKILQNELRQQGEKGKRRADAVRLINFYIVPNWNDTAYQIEHNATIMREQKYSVSKHNNKIAIEKILGKEVAQRVFPDDRKVPTRFETILSNLKDEIDLSIKDKGFAIIETIFKKRMRAKEKNGKIKEVTLKEKEDVFKRAIAVDETYKISSIRSEGKKKELGFTEKNPKTIRVIYSKK